MIYDIPAALEDLNSEAAVLVTIKRNFEEVRV